MARLCCTVLLLLAVTGTFGLGLSGYRNGTDTARITGTGVATLLAADVAPTGDYKFLCSLQDVTTAATVEYGPCVIIHKYWVIAHVDLHKTITIDMLRVTPGTIDGTLSNSETRKVKERVVQPAFVPQSDSTDKYCNKIQLVRVCPSILAARIFCIGGAPTGIVPTDPYTYLNFHPALKSDNKLVGEDCECEDYYVGATSDYTTKVAPCTFCGQEIIGQTIDTTDKVGTVAVFTDGGKKYGGFFLANDKGGDLFLEVSAYKTWIETYATLPCP